jgi:hypothetical protein
MKHYEKRYEDVYSSKRIQGMCNLGDISNAMGISNQAFITLTQEVWKGVYKQFFDSTVKVVWMSSKYIYNGRQRRVTGRNSLIDDYSYAAFMDTVVGIGGKAFRSSDMYRKFISYFDDFFPEFGNFSPFDDPEYFEFPYKNITPEFLMVVYQMPERLELLSVAEKEKMTYGKFVDYVINYIYCYNEEIGKNLYIFMKTDNVFPYVKYTEHMVNKKYGRRRLKRKI